MSKPDYCTAGDPLLPVEDSDSGDKPFLNIAHLACRGVALKWRVRFVTNSPDSLPTCTSYLQRCMPPVPSTMTRKSACTHPHPHTHTLQRPKATRTPCHAFLPTPLRQIVGCWRGSKHAMGEP
eukprot:1158508-Pelagomonas_calceolata.AAC.47